MFGGFLFNPILMAFCQPKITGGWQLAGQNGRLLNSVISSQMAVKLIKDILWVEIFTN